MTPVVDLVRRYSEEMTPTQWVTLATWVFITAFVAVEMLQIGGDTDGRDSVRTRVGPAPNVTLHREGRTALVMACGALVVGVAYGAVFAASWRAVGGLAPPTLVGFWQRHPVAAALCAFVAWDFSGWIYHLIGHRTRIGWAAHSPHHSGTLYNASLALRLSWMPWHGLLHHPLIALAGFPLPLILGCLAVSNALQAIQHSAILPEAPRWLAAVVMTPQAHRHHHGPHGDHRNLGPVFTIWDRLAGTWFAPEADTTGHTATGHTATGHTAAGHTATVQSATTPGAVRVQLAGWRQLLARTPPRAARGHDRQPTPRSDTSPTTGPTMRTRR